jgi:hypothetical protein
MLGSMIRRTSFPKLPRARGQRLTWLAEELRCPRSGFWEKLPLIGDVLLRRRIRRTRLARLAADRPLARLFSWLRQ